MLFRSKPEKHIRYGAVRVSIWHDTRKRPDGSEFETRSVTLGRADKDQNNKWQNTSSMREADIPKAILALSKAFEYMTRKDDDAAETEE